MSAAAMMPIGQLRRDDAVQPRAEMDPDTVNDYAHDMSNGSIFPPVVAFRDGGGTCWLADGFHRVAAAEYLGLTEILIELRDGSREDAAWFALGANQKHGLRRTNADKRRAVQTALEHPRARGLSARQVAEHCGVSNDFVSRVKKLSSDDTSPLTRVKGRDGKSYPARHVHVDLREFIRADARMCRAIDEAMKHDLPSLGSKPLPVFVRMAEGDIAEARNLEARCITQWQLYMSDLRANKAVALEMRDWIVERLMKLGATKAEALDIAVAA